MIREKFVVQEAERNKEPARVSFEGPSGSGKTWVSLVLASYLAGVDGVVGVIDTENRSARKYAGEFAPEIGRELKFKVIELSPPFSPERYLAAFDTLVDLGCVAVVTDSTTHEWRGQGGCLEIHQDEVSRQRTKNSYAAWAEVTPRHDKFLDRLILRSPVHTIGTVRAKEEYVQTKDADGRTKIEKVGMGAIQRDQFRYEWDVYCELDQDHNLLVSKSRCRDLDGRLFRKNQIGDFGDILKTWLDGGRIIKSIIRSEEDLRNLGDLMRKAGVSFGELNEKFGDPREASDEVWYKLHIWLAEKTQQEV